jgi:hypothetical protein
MARVFMFVVLNFMYGCSLWAQSSFTLKYYGLTIHPLGDASAELQPRKLDKNAVFVLNTGVFLGFEKFVHQDLISIKLINGVLSDCSKGLAVVSHVGIRATLYQAEKHRFTFGLGPTFIARESWSRFGSVYASSGFFNEAETNRFGAVQWKFIPYGIDLEYDYCITQNDNLSFSLTPGIPLANICSVGWKHWFNFKTFDRIFMYQPD